MLVYHINCLPEEILETIITVGDPDVVKEVSKYFDRSNSANQHREFVTHTGYIGNKTLSVTSTGIGPDNIDIVLNELDALVNIDFSTRTIKKTHTTEYYPVGTSGSAAFDTWWQFCCQYTWTPVSITWIIFISTTAMKKKTAFMLHIHHNFWQPGNFWTILMEILHYLKKFVDGFHHGITVTCPRLLRVTRKSSAWDWSTLNWSTSLHFSFGNQHSPPLKWKHQPFMVWAKILGHHCFVKPSWPTVFQKNSAKDGGAAVENLN